MQMTTAVHTLLTHLYKNGLHQYLPADFVKDVIDLEKKQIVDAKNNPDRHDAYWQGDVLVSSGEVYYNKVFNKIN
jgi:hypothetical protein